MNEQGLAQASRDGFTLDQVLMALKQGATPEQLVQMGVPQDLIMRAVQMLQEPQTPMQPAQMSGLAGMQTGRGNV